MTETSLLQTEIKKSHPLLKKHIKELQSEIARLQEQIARLEAKKISSEAKILVYQKAVNEYEKKKAHELALLIREAEKEANELLAQAKVKYGRLHKKP